MQGVLTVPFVHYDKLITANFIQLNSKFFANNRNKSGLFPEFSKYKVEK